MARFDFRKTVRLICQTKTGRERAMYPHLRDLFVHALGHPAENVLTDVPQEGGGSAPDLVVRCDVGIKKSAKKGKRHNLFHDWIVVEAKAKGGVFANLTGRARIFDEKSKYVRLETEYFIMVDPECIVVRPVVGGSPQADASNDMVCQWSDFETVRAFQDKFGFLAAGDSLPSLKNFRAGDESRMAIIKVDAPAESREGMPKKEAEKLVQGRKYFLDTVRGATALLQYTCQSALEGYGGKIADISKAFADYEKKWGSYTLSYKPLLLKREKELESKEEFEAHKAHSEALMELVKKDSEIVNLAVGALPAHYQRTGTKNRETFAIESANLLLARILLLRFFEDHGFFEDKKFPDVKRYVCNGGVKALQDFMKYYDEGYNIVLREAYKKGGQVYDKAFEWTDLDWVLAHKDENVSRAIELTMMQFSRFDFSTISGDILTGIYDRFLDPKQRKAMGEYYTPPSVARYIVERLDVQAHHSVFDPACGSGTFLLEAFARMTKGDIQSGRGDYRQAEKVLKNIGGNDLNPFSGMLALIQMLWHLLPLKDDIKKKGFPDILISRGINSVVEDDKLLEKSRDAHVFAGMLDKPCHDMIIGNPPYVRPERSGDFDDATQQYYGAIGGAKKNLYDLFVYKALHHWCKKMDENNGEPGKLGFVLQLSFSENSGSKDLRKLFALGDQGKFRILEIVDMELITPYVFDAAISSMILIAENRPAQKEDKVTIRVAGAEAVDNDEGEINLHLSPSIAVDYKDIWTDDGRILTKFKKRHRQITSKMGRAEMTVADIAREFWLGKEQGARGRWVTKKWSITPPDDAPGGDFFGGQAIRWEKDHMLRMGAAERRRYAVAGDGSGMDYYKGENISACAIEGEPQRQNIAPDSLDDPSLWRYRDILPSVGYAFLRISRGVTAAQFNPQKEAFLNTATLLFPNEEWENFPLDAAMLSNVYQFYYGVVLREGIITSFGSNVYPRTIEKMPLPPALLADSKRLNKLRDDYLALCRQVGARTETLMSFMKEVKTTTVKKACRELQLGILWSDGMNSGQSVFINAPMLPTSRSWGSRLPLGEKNYLEIEDKGIIKRIAVALVIYHEQELKREDFQNMRIPADDAALAEFQKKARKYLAGGYDAKLEAVVEKIDNIVGAAFQLSARDIGYIRKEMKNDLLLRNLGPNMPFTGKTKRGISENLTDPERYE